MGRCSFPGRTSLMAIGAVLGKRWDDGTSILCTTAWQLVAGGVELMIVAVLVEGNPPHIDAERLMAFSYVSLIAIGLACVCLFTAFRHLKAGTVGMLQLLNAITGVALGVCLSSESLSIIQTSGIVLALLGIDLGQIQRWPTSEATVVSQRLNEGSLVLASGAVDISNQDSKRA